MSDNYFTRLYNAILGKSYAKEISKPKEENRGASWNSAGGVRNTFSAQASMDAYGIHGYTHAGVKRLSQDLAALPLKLIKGYGDQATEVMDHPVLDLIRMPSTDTDEFLFREQVCIDLTLTGNCYILLLGSSSMPVSMVRLHPEEVRIITDPQKGLVGYEHNSSGSVVQYPPERIIHGKNAGYEKGPQALYGTGAIQPLARELDADLNSQKLVSEATNKGRPDVLLSPSEDGDIWPQEVRKQILDQYAGMQKSGGAMVLSGQVNVDMLQLSPRDMEFQASRTFARESISAVLGIPPSVLGLPTANYALGRQQAIEYWSNQIKRGKRIALLFTRIARLWDNDLHFEHDYQDVEALQSIRNDKLMRVEKHIFFGISPEVAYAAEGLEFPRKQEPKDYGKEEEENVRYLLDVIKNNDNDIQIKAFDSEYLDNLEVVNIPSNPQGQEEADIIKSILGPSLNWEDYKNAHLFFNANQDQMKEGYYIRIGRRLNEDEILNATPTEGRIVIFKDLLDLAVDHLNGRYGRPPITEDERRGAYKNIVKYFKKMNLEAPVLLDSYLSFDSKKKESDLTNFPKKGDDKKVSLRNSQWKTFDTRYAEKLKKEYPAIWRAGGNIRGNEQYRKLLPISKNNGVPKNLTEERAIRLREAWVARHLKDGSQFSDPNHPITVSSVAGIVAQIKWLAIGSIGESKMKKVLNELKRKLDAKKSMDEKKKITWNNWVTKSQSKVEKEFVKKFKQYLDQAKKRYIKRLSSSQYKNNQIQIDRETFMDLVAERRELDEVVGDSWINFWVLTGNDNLNDLYRRTGKEKPLDLVFGSRDYAKQLWNDSVYNITNTTANNMMNLVLNGLNEGLSTAAIAELITADTSNNFGLGRANLIARTEATRVINQATVESYRVLGEQGIQVKKQWLSSFDDRVRDSHRWLNGKTVDANEDFVLPPEFGGHRANSPASFDVAGENINCRCTVVPVIID